MSAADFRFALAVADLIEAVTRLRAHHVSQDCTPGGTYPVECTDENRLIDAAIARVGAIWNAIDRDVLRAALLAEVRREVEELTTYIDVHSARLTLDRDDVLRLLGDPRRP